jgi:hypothetical protein
MRKAVSTSCAPGKYQKDLEKNTRHEMQEIVSMQPSLFKSAVLTFLFVWHFMLGIR